MPTMLLVAPPSEKGQTTMDTIKSALPSRGKTAEIIAACYTLSRRGKDEVSVMGVRCVFLCEEDYTSYKEALNKVTAEIRNSKRSY